MKVGLSVKIDVTKIDKSRIFEGQKGKYLDLTTFIDLDNKDQYDNNGFISQSVTKEERAANVQTPILGNVKVFYREDNKNIPNARPNPEAAPQTAGAPHIDLNDDIPF